MKTLCFWVSLLVGICLRSSFAFPSKDYAKHGLFQRPQTTVSSQHTPQQKAPAEEGEQVNTVQVTCHPDSLEIIIKADLFGVGAPVNSDELRLGVEHDGYCRATMSSGDEYRILVGLVDCGTKHWMTADALVYTNLLIYSPVASPYGVVRMDEAVIPLECHYERKYSLSSSSLMPTWIPFMSNQAAEATLAFDLRIMTNDWSYRRSSNVFYIGEPINIEASVRVGHHMELRVFVSSCVATLTPDIYSVPRYVFVENGCLVDSELPGSRAHFLSRTQDDKLQLNIDAFRFHNEDQGQLYITCHLNAVPANDAEAPNKACTLVNGRWRSADGNDYLCGYCESHDKPSSPGKFGPRGFVNPDEPFSRSRPRTNTVWEQEARVGPMMVLPAKQKSEPIPEEELPAVNKIGSSSLDGSQWRSGIHNKVDKQEGLLLGSQSTPDEARIQSFDSKKNEDVKSETDPEDENAVEDSTLLETASPDVSLKLEGAVLDNNGTAALGMFGPRGFVNPDEPEPFTRSRPRTNTVWEQEARVGPMMVLPTKQKSEPIPEEELPAVNKIVSSSLDGSQWRSGINDKQEGLLLGSQSTPDEARIQSFDSKKNDDVKSETDPEDENAVEDSALLETTSPDVSLKLEGAVLDNNGTAALGMFGPRGFVNPDEPEPFTRSRPRTNTVWEQEARVGPMMVLPAKQKSEPIPEEELPAVNKIVSSSLDGSQWRSGINDKQEGLLLGSQSTPDEARIQSFESKKNEDVKSETDPEDENAVEDSALLETTSPDVGLKSEGAALDNNGTAALGNVSPTAQFTVAVTKMSNATGNALSDTNDPEI